MKLTPFSIAFAALLHAAWAQDIKPVALPKVMPPFLKENQLIETGGFESPMVKGRVAKEEKEGNFIRHAQGEWIHFKSNKVAVAGKVTAGLTNETSYSGRQAMWVQFDHTKERQATLELASNLIPVMPAKPYHVGIWGRIDAKNPITIDQRVPLLRLRIEFYLEDQETQTGESIYKVQPIPGTRNRKPLFTTKAWNEFFTEILSPEDAAFIKVNWEFLTAADDGETNGVVYFDDATIEGEKVELPPEPEPTDEKPEDSAKPGTTPTATPAAPEEAAPPVAPK